MFNAEIGVETLPLPADLTQPDAARKLAAQLRRRRVAIDILVNNAGVLEHAPFIAFPARRHQPLICMNGEAIVVYGIVNRAVAMAARTAPKWIVRPVGGAAARAIL